jgi:hypothetical protein
MAFGWPKPKAPPPTPPGPAIWVQAAAQQPVANPNVGQPAHVNTKKPSDQRFRSFAERYIIARAHFFRVPSSEHTEDQWSCIMDAKRVYSMIERVGQNIEPEDGVF